MSADPASPSSGDAHDPPAARERASAPSTAGRRRLPTGRSQTAAAGAATEGTADRAAPQRPDATDLAGRAIAGRPARFALVAAWAALAAQLGIVVTGALVRLTGSGLGCPTWPECMPGSYTPVPHPATREHAYIEFGNRLLTFAVAATAVAALVTGWRHSRRTGASGVRLLSAVPLLGTLAQAVVGGLTVLTGLSPWWVSAHFLVSVVVIAFAQVYVVRLQQQSGVVASRPPGLPNSRLLALAAATVTTLGVVVTGSGPHAGDADVVARLPIHPLVATVLHSSAAWALAVITVIGWRRCRSQHSDLLLRRLYTRMLWLLVCQGALGYAQSALGLPIALVAMHVLGAVLIWSGAVRICATQEMLAR